MTVMIGVDPHKATHTAVAIDGREVELARFKVRASKRQSAQLLEWARGFEGRAWAIESASGLGYLLAQQLLAAGETVLDVPATLAARVRVLGTGRSDKNDPNELSQPDPMIHQEAATKFYGERVILPDRSRYREGARYRSHRGHRRLQRGR